jgi:cysteine desulfurase
MKNKRVYMDYAATTPCDPQVLKAMEPYFFEKFGNASSIHGFGQEARAGVEAARQSLADAIGARPQEIVFTSGGTEADNFAIKGVAAALREKGSHIITSSVEHHAVSEPCAYLKKQGFEVTFVPVDRYGMVDPEAVRAALTDKTILVSVMHANNEIGTIQPIAQIGALCRSRGVYMHTDAVQTVGHIPVNVDELNVDLLSLSAHKFYGPKGVGALYIRKGTRIEKILHGGEQEQGKRPSTYNTAGIVGLGAAIDLCRKNMDKEAQVQTRQRDRIIAQLQEKIPHVTLNGHPVQRLPNNANLSFNYIEGESILLNLDMLGIAASTGSACTSASLEPSHVLLAIGLSHEVAHGTLRFSIGRWTTDEDVDFLLEQTPAIIANLRAMSPLYEGKH